MKMGLPLFFLVFLCLFNCALSESTIGIFDVSSTLQLAHDIIHSKPQSPIPNHLRSFPNSIGSSSSSSSSISLELESRESVHRSNHTDYKSLVLSRLERDSARVKAITSRIQLLIDGVSKSDLMNYDLSLPVNSGLQHGTAEFFARIAVGTPPKPYFMVLDTGSHFNWIQCQPCTKCYKQLDPIFDPTASSSYSPLPCDSTQCRSLPTSTCPAAAASGDGHCPYKINYGDGSFTFGEMVNETVSFGGSRVVNNITLGCGHDNRGMFVGSAGLIGMGRSPLSLPSQLNSTSFSYCFVNENNDTGSSTIDFNLGRIRAPVVATLVKNSKVDIFYYIKLTGISINNRLLPIPESIFQIDKSGNGGVIVDSGTSITRLQSKAYNVLRDAFRNTVRGLKPIPETGGFDTCYMLEEEHEVPIPTVQFHFGKGQIWDLLPNNYLFLLDAEARTFCLAFRPATNLLSIIGNYQQQTTRISFDLINRHVGFSPKSC